MGGRQGRCRLGASIPRGIRALEWCVTLPDPPDRSDLSSSFLLHVGAGEGELEGAGLRGVPLDSGEDGILLR